MSSNEGVEIVPQVERAKRFGIECIGPRGDGLLYAAGTWKPGGDYVQKLIVRNVSTEVKHLKYKLPATRFFSLAYPETIILVPGNSFEIAVNFRPVEYKEYDDTILFKMQEGNTKGQGFHIPIRATIEKLKILAPCGVDFGFCPTYQTSSLTFQLSNIGEISSPFRWVVPPPFSLSPLSGILNKGESIDITVVIYPTDGSVFVSQALCYVGEGVDAIIPNPVIVTKISAICKYAYISLSESEVSFGEIFSGTPSDSALLKKEIMLRNSSVVPAEFELVREDDDRDEVFDIVPRNGLIDPNSELPISISYHPKAQGLLSVDRYTFRTPGNCAKTLTVQAFCKPLAVKLYKDKSGIFVSKDTTFPDGSPGNSINFNDIELGHSETRILYLFNDSDNPTYYSVDCHDSIFQVEPKLGVCPPRFQTIITLRFAPASPMNYCRRIFVLVSDALPLFFDVLGTGYIRAHGEIKEQRPAPLRHAHIQAFRNRHVNGYGTLNPDELDELYKNSQGLKNHDKLFANVGEVGTAPLFVPLYNNPLTRTAESTRCDIATAHEFFIDDTNEVKKLITLSANLIDFGYTPHLTESVTKTITLKNNTNGKVTVAWQVGKYYSNDDVSYPFVCEPNVADCNAHSSVKFNITFIPNQVDVNYFLELEAYVYYKNQRTFRLVNDPTMTPPWCLTTKLIGHTFATGQLLARVKLCGNNIHNDKLIFPSTYIGDSTYLTIMLKNTSNLPATFRFSVGWNESKLITDSVKEEQPRIFSVKPIAGEIPADKFALILIKFSPIDNQTFKELLRCYVNGDCTGKLFLEGSSSVPYFTFPDVEIGKSIGIKHSDLLSKQNVPRGLLGTFYLKPTFVGLSSNRKLYYKNASRIPLKYSISIENMEDSGESLCVNLSHMKGLLRGNEAASITISFAPRHSKQYRYKLKVKVFSLAGDPSIVLDARQPGVTQPPELLQTISVLIIGQGDVGALIFDPPRVTPGPKLVDCPETKDIYIENISDSNISYRLMYKEELVSDVDNLTYLSDFENLLTLKERASLVTMKDPVFRKHNLFCEYPSGILPARSKRRVPFTFHSVRPGLFEFTIIAKVRLVDEHGVPIELSNEEAMLLKLQMDNLETIANTDIINTLPLSANVTARASYPTLAFTDIRTDVENHYGTDISQLWRQFSISTINSDLMLPLTEMESVNNSKSSPDLSLYRKYSFMFTPNTIGNPAQCIYLKLENNGFLTSSFTTIWPNNKKLNLEAWCDEDEPSAELNQIIDIIEKLNCFTFEPKCGTLEPGESVTLKLSYNYSHLNYEGMHKVPITVKVDRGRVFVLELIGQTLSHPTPPKTWQLQHKESNINRSSVSNRNSTVSNSRDKVLNVANRGNKLGNSLSDNNEVNKGTTFLLLGPTGTDGIYQGNPVPIGIPPNEAIRQQVEITNVSAQNVDYVVNMKDFEAFNESNYGLNIITISNPVGVINAKSSVFLDVYFCPIQAKLYEFELNIEYKPVVEKVYSTGLGEGNNRYDPSLSIESHLYSGIGVGKENSIMSINQNSIVGEDSVAVLDNASFIGSIQPERGSKIVKNMFSRGRNSMSLEFAVLPQQLRFALLLVGYDPTQGVPATPANTYPLNRSITLKEQLLTVSNDNIDFGVIPTRSVGHNLAIIRNNSPNSVVIDIDLKGCSLFADGFLVVTPLHAKLNWREHCVIDIKIGGNSRPCMFHDKIIIVAREIIPNARGSRRAAVGLDRRINSSLSDKKCTEYSHSSVIVRSTVALTSKMSEVNMVEFDKYPKLPTTVDSKGSLQQLPHIVPKTSEDIAAHELASRNNLEESVPLRSQTAPQGSRRVIDNSISSSIDRISNKESLQRPSTAIVNKRENVLKGSQIIHGELLGAPQIYAIHVKGAISSEDLITVDRLEEYVRPINKEFIPHLKQSAPAQSGTINIDVPCERQREIRFTSEDVLCKVIGDILYSDDIQDFALDIYEQGMKRNLSSASLKENGVLGTSVYGVYHKEIMNGSKRVESSTKLPLEKKVLLDNDFFDLTREVLRNTMYNLIQEASCGESTFGLLKDNSEDPLEYMTK